MYTHTNQVIRAGISAPDAKGALIMLHGRGGSAQDIVSLSEALNVKNLAIYAPQASQHSWYPYGFMADEVQNQPALDSAIETVEKLVEQIQTDGFTASQIYFLGFSQGACLMLEFMARYAKRYAGAVAFTGGLIGKQLQQAQYVGDFGQTLILITTSDPDLHVPLSRVKQSVTILQKLGAKVNLEVYSGKPHTITQDEINLANAQVFLS